MAREWPAMAPNTEHVLAESIASYLARRLVDINVVTKCNLLYSSIIHDLDGKRVVDVDADGRTIRRGGAYQQDILMYDDIESGDVREIPRVSIELKAGRVTTHDALVYAEKARQLRTVYPYLRFLFVVAWQWDELPVRLIKSGASFDAMMVVHPTTDGTSIERADLRKLKALVEEEVASSRLLGDVLFRRQRGGLLHRRLVFR